jgi:hypothetical protein
MPSWAMALILTISVSHGPDRVQVKGEAGDALRRAIRDAEERLRDPACRAVLGDFRALEEGTMEARLATLDLTADAWLERLVFADGVGQAACRRSDVILATSPGSRVVYACAARFHLLAARDPALGAVLVIHELLHSLGLPEAPPSSREITGRVRARCAP